jgi:GDP-L-fucose synthase|tara:strand:+ start:5801 stop:6721 length:921 start_codon:yes stop_codon:yes gene_type:complete
MKILIVGSRGFLGSHVTEKLKNNENYDVLEIRGKDQVDILNIKDLNSYLDSNKPEIVINCAAFVGGISYGYKYPAQMLHINSIMALNLYKASYENGIKKLINPISNCAYPGDITTYKEEDFFIGPPDESVYNYGISKRLYVQLGKSFSKEYNFSSANVIVSNMYGPNDHFDEERSHALGAIIKKVYEAKKNNFDEVVLWGTGRPIREWLYVEDGADALINSIQLNKGHHFFNVGVKKGISVLDLAEIIKEEFGWNGKFVLDTSKPDGVLEKKVDGTLGQKKLNWKPEVDLTLGISKTVDWYINNNE